jgi:hypothetical protein
MLPELPSSKCLADDYHAMEPTLPIAPPLLPSSQSLNPCIETGNGTRCLPYVHVISGWHMFSEEAFGWFRHVKQFETRGGPTCFADWKTDAGGSEWVHSWGGPPSSGAVLLAHCDKLLSWYPAFAGRYLSSWGKAYDPCKAREIAAHPDSDYYETSMWQVCRPLAMRAHDTAVGVLGSGREATPPFVLRALYGTRVRLISAVRNPVDRLETAFWGHAHYTSHYGNSPAGLHTYAVEQTGAFNGCVRAHDVRRCAFVFELLNPTYGETFFHCDQIIRGLYEPFLRDWHAAFGKEALLVLRVEDLIDDPIDTREKLLKFLQLPGTGSAKSYPPITTTYRQLHLKSLRDAHAHPMNESTRAVLEGFYRRHNFATAALLGWPNALAWPASTTIDAAALSRT